MRLRSIYTDRIASRLMVIMLIAILCMPLVIAAGLFYKASPLLSSSSLWELIAGSAWAPTRGVFGFRPFIAGSLYVTLFAFLFASPVCLLAALYLTQFARARLVKILHPVIDILAGLPSVIYGVWGILVVVPLISFLAEDWFGVQTTGYSILAGGVVLAVMCIPYMLNMLIEVFRTVPAGLKEAALSVGATHWETVKHIVIRKSLPGIFSAFGLSIAKAFGETIAVMMVVGNSIGFSLNPLQPGYPLPALIANNYGEMLSIPMYDAALMFAALLLLVIILVINLVFRFIIYRTQLR
ncbi:MAG TPA: phosphate ABC transporter permease subunit PstC [Bacteroidales bacterium]|nr:phosphate ABC transporter permease subunit PstC [Bacteroidales bacterium]HRZ47890.1 phosphate ABC transporter permease subunit PstC [Bacteroidales bacterium]